MNHRNYITKEKKESLEEELEELKGPKRKEIINALEYAKSLGDLSENAEYHQAREDQGRLEERIKKLEYILQSFEVVSEISKDIVGIGSKIIVKKRGEEIEKTYQVVGSEGSDMSQGKISNVSPFGQAVLGKKEGEEFSFNTPSGNVYYKIIKII